MQDGKSSNAWVDGNPKGKSDGFLEKVGGDERWGECQNASRWRYRRMRVACFMQMWEMTPKRENEEFHKFENSVVRFLFR